LGAGSLKNFNDINTSFEGNLSFVLYMRLNEWSLGWNKKTLNNNSDHNSGLRLCEFLEKFKKGSQPFQRVLVKKYADKGAKTRGKIFEKFCNIAGIEPVLETDLIEKVVSWWDKNFLSNRQKEFLYKFVSNTLGTNSRVAHYNIYVNAGCTFCVLKKLFPAPQESFRHLFYDCDTVRSLHDRAANEFLSNINMADMTAREKLWFFGLTIDQYSSNMFLQTFIGCIQLYVWECKLRKVLPSWDSMHEFVYCKIKGMLQISSTLNDSRVSLNNNVFRRWE
jgi:hypothetical protein